MDQIFALYGMAPGTKPLGEGVEAIVYPLDDERVVRVYKRPNKAWKAQLEVMQSFYNSLDSSNVSFDVPKILSIDVTGGTTSTVDKLLHGQNLESTYDALDAVAKRKALTSYIAAAEQIRHLAPRYPYFGEVLADNPVREATWKAFLAQKIRLAHQQGRNQLSKELPGIQYVIDFMEGKLSLFDDVTEPSLVHGDYYVPNVLVQNGKVSAVLDFNDLTLAGDFRMDMASAVIFLDHAGTGTRDADKQVLVDSLVLKYGDGIKEIIHFYELYYALIFAAYSQNTGSSAYRWSINILKQQITSGV